MASLGGKMQRSLQSISNMTVRSGKSCRQVSASEGPIGTRPLGSQIGIPKVSTNAPRRTVSSVRDSRGSPCPFANKDSASEFTSGARCYSTQLSRLPRELAAVQSLAPYHSATADSLLVSRLGSSGGAPVLQDDGDGT